MKVDIVKEGGMVESMNIKEFSRWMCLMEALELIKVKAEEKKIKVEDIIKINAINDYISERYPAMLSDLTFEIKYGLL